MNWKLSALIHVRETRRSARARSTAAASSRTRRGSRSASTTARAAARSSRSRRCRAAARRTSSSCPTSTPSTATGWAGRCPTQQEFVDKTLDVVRELGATATVDAEREPDAAMSDALADLVVLDATASFWASLGAALLGDFGAQVIRVEDAAARRAADRDARTRRRRGTQLRAGATATSRASRVDARAAGRARDRSSSSSRRPTSSSPIAPLRRARRAAAATTRRCAALKPGPDLRARLRLRPGRARPRSARARRAGGGAHRHDADPAAARAAARLPGRTARCTRAVMLAFGVADGAASIATRRAKAGGRRLAARRQHVRREPRPAGVPRDRRRALPAAGRRGSTRATR